MANRLPVPLMNVINGGAHADNQLDIQEFMLVPYAADSFRIPAHGDKKVFHALKAILKRRLGDKRWR